MDKFGRKKKMTGLVEWLGEYISWLVLGGNEANAMTATSNLFTNIVVIKLNVLSAGMENRIGSHVSGAKIVTM